MAQHHNDMQQNFAYNSMLARALLALVPDRQKDNLQDWLSRLHETDPGSDDISLRNEYMWFLLLQLQTQKINKPFKDKPPSILKPLKEVMPAHIYEEVLTTSEQSMDWLDQVATMETAQEEEAHGVPPCMFLDSQPRPKEGVICYFAAFSDQQY